MASCPYCSHETEAGARVCKNCGRALVQRCVACAEDIPVLAAMCPLCKSPQNYPAPKAAAPALKASEASPSGPIGEDRNIFIILLLWFLTCGLWGLVSFYQLGADLNAHRRRNELSPGVDILLGFLTCGIWFVYSMYKYAQVLREISEEEGGPVQDVTAICLVLEVAKYFGCPGIISVMVLQNELNTHWKRHAATP
jgi:uncharacterized protein DUF4234/double zinc ribbon protein